ncbi:MAG: outer membrane beta-barrel protein [Dysgonomonas sp.]
MKKKLLVLACLLVNITLVSAQDIFKQGDKVLNIGIGFGNTLYTGSGYSTKIPPISASLDVCIKDNLFDEKSSLGVGGFIGYASSEYKIFDYKHKYSDFILGARGTLNYQFVEKLDTYAGLALGYDIVSASSSGTYADYSASASGLTFGIFAGARYYFTDQLAGMVELGYDIAVAKIGIAYKF